MHTGSSEGVSDKYLLTFQDPGQKGSPGRNRIFMVTQRRVNMMSCNTVNVPCFLGLFGPFPRHHLMRPGIGLSLITTSSFGSDTRVSGHKSYIGGGHRGQQCARCNSARELSICQSRWQGVSTGARSPPAVPEMGRDAI